MEKFANKGFMIKKFYLIILIFSFLGCSSTYTANYIKDFYPYKRRMYASFSQALAAVEEELVADRWEIKKKIDPSIYEQSRQLDIKQILVITEIRKSTLSLGTRSEYINVYIREVTDQAVEIEVRYLTLTSVPFKKFYDYRRDSVVDHLLDGIEEKL